MEPSSPSVEADHYSLPCIQSRKAKKTPARVTDSASTHEIHRVTGQFEEADGHRMDPARRARMERDDHGRSSPRSDDRSKGLKRSHYSPPREGRGRRSSKRVRRWREKSRSGSPSSHGEREGSTELLPRVSHRNNGDGRLSYWDDGYDDIKMSDMGSSEEARRLRRAMYQPSNSLEAEIQRKYPDADPIWVSEMASFDLDEFFGGLGDHKLPAITLSVEEDARIEMDISSDRDDGQALPTVKLPPVREAFRDTISDTKESFHNHQSQSLVDDRPRTNNNEEGSRYDLEKGGKDKILRETYGEIVVKLPKGGGPALDLDRFSAQLRVDSRASSTLNSEMDPKATNANS